MSKYIDDVETILNNLSINRKMIVDKLRKCEEYESTGFSPEDYKKKCEQLDTEIKEFYKKIGDIEELEEQGLLIKLPCKIGTPVYFSTQDCNICKDVCDYSDWSEKSDKNYCRNSYIKSLPFEIGFIKYIGKSMFLSKEEVKKSLK